MFLNTVHFARIQLGLKDSKHVIFLLQTLFSAATAQPNLTLSDSPRGSFDVLADVRRGSNQIAKSRRLSSNRVTVNNLNW